MKKLAVIVLAAGQGTRMRSKLAKMLHPVCGRPMALYAVDLAESLAKGRVAVVVGHQAEKMKDLLTRVFIQAMNLSVNFSRISSMFSTIGSATAVLSTEVL